MPSNIIERQDDIIRIVAHVEAFIWDPLTPVVLSLGDYSRDTMAMTTEEATQTANALLEAVAKVNEGVV